MNVCLNVFHYVFAILAMEIADLQHAAVRKMHHTNLIFLLVNTFASECKVAVHVKENHFSKLYSKYCYFAEGNVIEGMIECMFKLCRGNIG